MAGYSDVEDKWLANAMYWKDTWNDLRVEKEQLETTLRTAYEAKYGQIIRDIVNQYELEKKRCYSKVIELSEEIQRMESASRQSLADVAQLRALGNAQFNEILILKTLLIERNHGG